jgi:hypothetical protein
VDFVPLIRPIRLFSPFSNFRRPKGQNSSDIDQIVGDHAQSDPSFHAIVAAIATAIQAMTTLEHTDPSFAPCPPSLRLSEPAFLL